MTSKVEASHRSSAGAWFAILISALILVMIAGATLAAAPFMEALMVRPASTSRPVPWAPANIAKPTYTASPLPTFTLTPIPVDTPTVGVVLADSASPLSSNAAVELDLPGSSSQNGSMSLQGGKYILVSISEQHLTAYENGQLIYSFVASTGMRNSTRAGSFSVLDKIPNAYGSTWNIWMPDWLGIYYAGTLENGIHALPILPSGDELWAGYLGTPISFGCVVLGPNEALQLYNWSDVGTPVEIRW